MELGNGKKCKVLGKGTIGKHPNLTIENVDFVEGLTHNLISIGQLCSIGYKVLFVDNEVHLRLNDNILYKGTSLHNIYSFNLDNSNNLKCLVISNESSWLWHRRLGHAGMDQISQLICSNLVRGLPTIKFEKDQLCDACQKGKQHRVSFPSKKVVSTSRPLELLHLDLFGPTQVASLGGMRYCLVIVDDFSRYSWVYFLALKSETFQIFRGFVQKVENENSLKVIKIRSDHGGEFINVDFENFCFENGYSHNFSAPRTPQQNGVVERKNRTLQEMARTMISEYPLKSYFWAEATSTACYILNRVSIRPILRKTPYELYRGRLPLLSYFRPFGCSCYILREGERVDKFDAKSDLGIFVGYAPQSKAYRVFNLRTNTIRESVHVEFDEKSATKPLALCDDSA